ncbi:MAG: carotenoid oxygenase family protein [Acidimicrobiales bacterium]
MAPQLVDTITSTLPADDDHPYRTGPWRPQVREWTAELEVVEGEIPADLDGAYLRNTENPLHPAITRYHPFDGDGMVHAVEFRDGRAAYWNRFVRTDGLLAEQEAGEALWTGFIEMPDDAHRTDGWGIRGRMKDASSTDVVVHRGEVLTSFYFCGDLYRLDPATGATLGKQTWDGTIPSWGVSAHPKVDPHTGELLFFAYSKEEPFLRTGAVGADGTMRHLVDVPLPGPRLPHDMAFTENHVILNDFPLFWRADLLEAGVHIPHFHRELPSRFAIVPRDGSGQVRWFEADPTYVLHFVNAWEEGDEIVLDGFFQHCPSPSTEGAATVEDAAFRSIGLDNLRTVLHRWRFDLRTGATTEEDLSDRVTEFGTMHPGMATRPNRYVYAATGVPGKFLFDGLVRHDLQTGAEDSIVFGDGVFGSETMVAPRPGATAEDDAYLVTFTIDMGADASYCVVYDAADPGAGPVCRLRLPERISSGTHATWASRAELGTASMFDS